MAANASDETINFCQRCGENLPHNASVCPRCGYPVVGAAPGQQIPSYQPSDYGAQYAPHTNRPTIGGVCLVLAGIIGIVAGILISLTVSEQVNALAPILPMYTSTQIEQIVWVEVGLELFVGFVALVGGVMALRRVHWGIAVIGGIFGLLTFGIFFIEGTVLALIGLVYIILSKAEFRRK